MKRLVLAGALVFVSWALLDALAHRLLLRSLYEATPDLWRPFSRCGHSPWLERQAKRAFFDALEAWLEELLRPALHGAR